jgi:hypothetical protein
MRLYRKIDIYQAPTTKGRWDVGPYLASTNQSRTCREAVESFPAARFGLDPARIVARFAKD